MRHQISANGTSGGDGARFGAGDDLDIHRFTGDPTGLCSNLVERDTLVIGQAVRVDAQVHRPGHRLGLERVLLRGERRRQSHIIALAGPGGAAGQGHGRKQCCGEGQDQGQRTQGMCHVMSYSIT